MNRDPINSTEIFTSLNTEDIFVKWVSWTCLTRLDTLSRDIEFLYNKGDEWHIDYALFRRGMAMEASWMACVSGWAATRSILPSTHLQAAYTRVLGASKGEVPLEDALFTGDELWNCSWALGIKDEDDEELADIDMGFKDMFHVPPRWWTMLQPEANGNRRPLPRKDALLQDSYMDCIYACEYVRHNADFGQDMADKYTEEVLMKIDEAQKVLEAMGVDISEQQSRIDLIVSQDERELLKTFRATHSDVPLTSAE